MKALTDIMLPDDRRYTDEHVWAQKDGEEVLVGISDYAQDQLGEVVFVDLPEVGARFEAAAAFGTVESIKSVNELYMPVTGTVTAVNEALDDSPSLINVGCYDKAWIIRVAPDNPQDLDGLLTSPAYRSLLEQ